jgi:hypothetical protein
VRPCEAMTIRSQPFDPAVSMIPDRDAHAPRGPFRRRRLPLPLRARQFSRPAFAHLLVNAGCVEVVIVTNENSTIDPTYDVNDASDGP